MDKSKKINGISKSSMSDSTMKTVLILINHYLPGYKSGGPIQTISNTVYHLGDEINFKIITMDRDATDKEPYKMISSNRWTSVGNAEVYYLGKKKGLIFDLIKIINNTEHDILYLNSFFNLVFTIIPLFSKKIKLIPNKKTVLAPRGELSLGALQFKKTKKKLMIKIYKIFNLSKDVIWQASSKFEKEEIKQIMKECEENIIVAPNLPAPKKEERLYWEPKRSNLLKVIFLSRITPMKNLDYALEIFKRINFSVEFTIIGPIRDEEYWEKCKTLIETLPSNIKVNYLGSIPHNKVIENIAVSDLFFLPTKGENFGHIILEAAIAGTPLLISDRTPWVNLEKKGVGWELPLESKKDFISKLKMIFEMDKDAHMLMRSNVKDWSLTIQNDAETIEMNKFLFS